MSIIYYYLWIGVVWTTSPSLVWCLVLSFANGGMGHLGTWKLPTSSSCAKCSTNCGNIGKTPLSWGPFDYHMGIFVIPSPAISHWWCRWCRWFWWWCRWCRWFWWWRGLWGKERLQLWLGFTGWSLVFWVWSVAVHQQQILQLRDTVGAPLQRGRVQLHDVGLLELLERRGHRCSATIEILAHLGGKVLVKKKTYPHGKFQCHVSQFHIWCSMSSFIFDAPCWYMNKTQVQEMHTICTSQQRCVYHCNAMLSRKMGENPLSPMHIVLCKYVDMHDGILVASRWELDKIHVQKMQLKTTHHLQVVNKRACTHATITVAMLLCGSMGGNHWRLMNTLHKYVDIHVCIFDASCRYIDKPQVQKIHLKTAQHLYRDLACYASY